MTGNQHKIRTIICKECGISVTKRQQAKTMFCSRDCAAKARFRGLKTGITTNCGNCNKEIYVAKNAITKVNFCCHPCSRKYLERKVYNKCFACGKEVQLTPKKLTKINYCSRECFNKKRIRKGVTFKCDFCSKDVYKIKCNSKKSVKNFCNKDCHDSYQRLPGPAEITRQRTIKRLEQKGMDRVSSIEYIVKSILDNCKINYIHQSAIDENGTYLFVVDFYLPNHNTIIEVNGTYWHSDPRFYPEEKLNEIQKINIKKYLDKVKIIKQKKINLLELWEYDIHNNIQMIQQQIRKLI